jgi:hypothetical protein
MQPHVPQALVEAVNSENKHNGYLLASNELDFTDLTPIEVPVKIGNKRYILCEAPHAVAKRYRAESLRGAELDMDQTTGKTTMRQFQGLASGESLLLSLCLHELLPNEEGDQFKKRKPVTQAFIESLPDRVTKSLYEKLMEICPSLKETETLENLYKQRDRINEKIKRLEVADPKKLLSSTTESSDLPMN